MIDKDNVRANAVAEMIRRCPEYVGSDCNVRSFEDIEEGLAGVDSLYVTMATTREPSWSSSLRLSAKYGIWHSDQLSTEGCLAAVRYGDAIMQFAKVMEKLAAPNATMLIFANPVAVFSAMVNKFTRIRAFGICAGFRNHKYDIPAICKCTGYDEAVNVLAAGVNHYAFMNSGEWKGRDVFAILDERLRELGRNYRRKMEDIFPGNLGVAYGNMLEDYDRNGTFLISSEADGLVNLAFKTTFDYCVGRHSRRRSDPDNSLAAVQKRYSHFYKLLESNDAGIWENDPLCKRNSLDLSNDIYAALDGKKTFRIFASRLNNGAVQDFPDDFVLEYSMDISRDAIRPAAKLSVPKPHFALVMQFAQCQTMLAEALWTHEPKTLAAVLNYWPHTCSNVNGREYNRTMLEMHDGLPEYALAAMDFL